MTERINALRELLFADAHKAYRKEDLGISILNEQTEKLPFAIRKAMAFACAVENHVCLSSGRGSDLRRKNGLHIANIYNRGRNSLGKPQFRVQRIQ